MRSGFIPERTEGLYALIGVPKVGKRYALKFISGKYEGGVFKLPSTGEVVIGRSSNVDVVIVEDMVSRSHARLTFGKEGSLYIEDLQSTNGSFVNGERITKAQLSEGDRILIGTSILKVMTVEDRALDRRTMPISDLTLAPPDVQFPGERTNASPLKSMEGLLSEVPLTDILQMFSTGNKTGVLRLKHTSRSGKIYMRDGRIVFASLDGYEDMPSQKVLFRMLAWNDGTFEMSAWEDLPSHVVEINESPQMLIMEGLRQIDELEVILEKHGLVGAMLKANFPLANPLKDLDSEALDLFQLLMEETSYEDLTARVSHDDLKVAELLDVLFKGKYIKKV
jgi:pSer/pThr/pTyr-binding forkhead associated (FHA) protein